MPVKDYLSKECIITELRASTKDEALAELAARAAVVCPGLDTAEVIKVLHQREALGSTGIGEGVAIPHGKVAGCAHITVILARSASGCDFSAVDGRNCHIFCLLLAPPSAAAMHLSVLAHFVRIFKSQEFRRRFMEAPDEAVIWALLDSAWKD